MQRNVFTNTSALLLEKETIPSWIIRRTDIFEKRSNKWTEGFAGIENIESFVSDIVAEYFHRLIYKLLIIYTEVILSILDLSQAIENQRLRLGFKPFWIEFELSVISWQITEEFLHEKVLRLRELRSQCQIRVLFKNINKVSSQA